MSVSCFRPSVIRKAQAILIVASICLAINHGIAHRVAAASQEARVPIAVFDFEFVNWSQEVDYGAKNEDEKRRLPIVSSELREILEQSGRYRLIDMRPAAEDIAKAGLISRCNGCDADIARKLGAELAISGVVQKLSVLVQTIIITIRDVKTGAVVKTMQTDIRGNTDEAWKRGVAWLARNRLLAP